jgi:hypothetical protein
MELKGWDKLYTEIAEKLTSNIEDIKWLDLWKNQISFLEEEHPFPTPAVFLSFRILNTQDISEKVQNLEVQVDVYLFYETFLDTYQGAYNQDDALQYLEIITNVFKQLHASTGENYSEMRRTGFNAVDTGSAGNLYLQNFTCNITDVSAVKEFDNIIPGEIDFEEGKEEEVPTEPVFKIPLTGN